MKPAVWMAAVSLSSWLVMTLSSQGRVDPELLLGMAGPTTSAVGSWVAYQRAHRAAPGRLTNVMIAALAVKMLFFGAYFVAVLRGFELRPVPFVVSFAGYFIALHAMEAMFLRRLLMNDLRSPSGERA
jgi:hypothetical protein